MSSPYSHLSDDALLDEIENIDQSIKEQSEQLTWGEMHDEDYDHNPNPELDQWLHSVKLLLGK